VNFKKQKSAEVVRHDNKTVKTLNVTLPSEGAAEEEPDTFTRMGALTFDPSPPLEEDKEFQLAATDEQAKLMRWHYRLGHLSFANFKLLTRNGEIPCRQAKIPAPKCVGCLFGAMTKLSWRGKESKSSRKVFVTTRPGECVSVNHMISTHVGFSQLKGKLTSKRYRAASIFVNHFSRLQYVHLMQDLFLEETIKAKDAFKRFAAEHGVAMKHYHCDNGPFADNTFQQACQQRGKGRLVISSERYKFIAAIFLGFFF
jgi:hypothetical protein